MQWNGTRVRKDAQVLYRAVLNSKSACGRRLENIVACTWNTAPHLQEQSGNRFLALCGCLPNCGITGQ